MDNEFKITEENGTEKKGENTTPSRTVTYKRTPSRAKRDISAPVRKPTESTGNGDTGFKNIKFENSSEQGMEIKSEPAKKEDAEASVGFSVKTTSEMSYKGGEEKALTKKKGVGSTLIVMGIALIGIALVIGIIVLIYMLSGNVIQKKSFTDSSKGVEYTVKYEGKVDEFDNPILGSFTYDDGSRGEISLVSEGIYKITYSDGSEYVGEVEKWHRNGEGTYTFSNGDKYTGEFSYDRIWGMGVYEYSNGDIYEGPFVDGKKDGENGKYTFASGDMYVGSFKNGMRNGEGVFTYADGSVYEGSYVNDKKQDDNAKLVIRFEDGTSDTYVGAFVNDMRSGVGTYTWANGDSYEGQFLANRINGKGKYTWASGRTYEGDFVNGAIPKDVSLYPEN